MKEGFQTREDKESRARLAGAVPTSLFLVERQLVGITEHQLAMLEAVIAEVTRRFADRGQTVRLVRSIFLPRQERLMMLFAAGSSEVVQAVNDAALVPFNSIEPAREMPSQKGT
ncbi:MAG TPA: hypothetical protein VGX22_04745 [Candidatus Dormibacteraeota bacterium]|nr:hypothetical protein [Candidatus Dormibacteraeota bacterium]